MSRAEFYPYPVAHDAVALDLRFEEDPLVEVSGRMVDAQALPDDQELRVVLSAHLEDGVLDRVLPRAEQDDPPVEMMVTVHSISSRYRAAVRLEPAGDGDFTGTTAIPKNRFHGALELRPALVRSAPGGEDGYARHKAALLAWGEPVSVQVDQPPPPPGDYLEVEFEDFLTSGNRLRNGNPDAVYMLDTRSETPKLWLNSRVAELERVLRSTAPRGRIRRIKDATYDTIVTGVWTSLALHATTALALQSAGQEGDETGDDPIDGLREWEQRVVGFWAPRLFPSASKEDALEELKACAADRAAIGELHDRLSIAVQEQAGSPEAFRGLVRWLNEENL